MVNISLNCTAKICQIFELTKDFNVFNICGTEVLKVLIFLCMSEKMLTFVM